MIKGNFIKTNVLGLDNKGLEDNGFEGEGSSNKEYSKFIKISVNAEASEAQSDVINNQFVFSYTILIQNTGRVSSQLINRHWKVFSNNIQIADVKGDGVIGQQPLLRPLDSFEYTSWSILNTPSGHMQGTFTFKSEDGVFFDVEVTSFRLEYNNRANVH
jgi:ApaG protein